MVAVEGAASAEAVGEKVVAAIGDQDWEALRECFAPDAQFRALIPRGLREAQDAAGAVEYVSGWFGDADQITLIASDVGHVKDRLSITYRFRAHEGAWYIVEQSAYCTVRDGRIERMDVLCSGFRPEAE